MGRQVRQWAEVTADPYWYRQIGSERHLYARPRQLSSVLRLANATLLAVGDVELNGRQPAKSHPKHVTYLAFEELLATRQVSMAPVGEGVDWDRERQPVDRIVLHHSKSPQPTRPGYHSAMELLRLYVPEYARPPEDDAPRIAAQPLMHSGHQDSDGNQVFWIYHHMVGADGQPTRYLRDDETGWQAGNWDVNCSSVAVCIDGDLSHRPPSIAELEGVKHIITSNYDDVNIHPNTLLGHNEVNSKTPCPGPDFLPAWKGQLLEMLGA